MSWIDDPRCHQGSRNQSGPLFDIGFRGPGGPKAVKGRHVTHEEPFEQDDYFKPKGIQKNRSFTYEDGEYIRQCWVDEGLTATELAEIFEVSYETIKKVINRIAPYDKES